MFKRTYDSLETFCIQVKTNDRAKIGGFLLGKELKAKFEEFTQFTSDERPSDPGIKMHAGLYFHAKDVWESEVGDIRVQFSYAGRDGEQVRNTYQRCCRGFFESVSARISFKHFFDTSGHGGRETIGQ